MIFNMNLNKRNRGKIIIALKNCQCTEQDIVNIANMYNIPPLHLDKDVLVSILELYTPKTYRLFKKWFTHNKSTPVDVGRLSDFIKHTTKISVYTVEYWMRLKGVSEQEAVSLVEKYKQSKVTSKEGFIKRHGVEEGIKKFEDFQRTSASSAKSRDELSFREASWMCVEYYTKRGYTEEDALVLIKTNQQERSGCNEQYWKNLGYSKDDIEAILSEQNAKKGWRNIEILSEKYQDLDEQELQTFIDNANMKMVDTLAYKGIRCPRDMQQDYEAYKVKAYSILRSLDKSNIDNIELRGKEHGYHLDHKFSILHGFINNVPVEHISHISNIQCIPSETNLKKGSNSVVTLQEFYANLENYKTGTG